jgi:hypothetical protein
MLIITPTRATEEALLTLSSILPHASCSSPEYISSDSFPTASHVNIQTGPFENVDVDLDTLIQHIFHLLKLINKKDIIPDECSNLAKTIGRSLLKETEHTHWVNAGLLVVPNISGRFETVLANGNVWFYVLEEMNRSAEYLQQLKERPGLRKRMENIIKEAIRLTVEASIMCCNQIDSSKFSRFFSTPINKDELGKVGPEHAVGIEESVKEVIDLLEWGSEKNAHSPNALFS